MSKIKSTHYSAYKAAFTLFELIIVIVIIGAVYLLFLSGFSMAKKDTKDFAKLKEIILNKSEGKGAKIICTGENCEQCAVYIQNTLEAINLDVKLFSKTPKIFEYDKYGYLAEKKYSEDICFEYEIYKNLSSDNVLIENNNKYYIFYSFQKTPDIFMDYSLATKRFNPVNSLPTATNEYYGAK